MTEQTERERLEALFAKRFPEHWMPGRSGIGPGRWKRFDKMLDAEAYESAALMLVPEGWSYILDTTHGPEISLWDENYCVAGDCCGGEPITASPPRANRRTIMDDPNEPLFSCQVETCRTEYSFPAGMLRLWNSKPICENCYDAEHWVCSDDDPLSFEQLPPFVPAYQARIEQLQRQLAERDAALEEWIFRYR